MLCAQINEILSIVVCEKSIGDIYSMTTELIYTLYNQSLKLLTLESILGYFDILLFVCK